MPFHANSNYNGKHAFLSPSSPAWVNYSEEKLARVYEQSQAAALGVEYHALAQQLIRLGEELPEQPRTLNLYVNDAIRYRMTPEVRLAYSENCFGTADAVAFDPIEKFLRIHDLKTGINEANPTQLLIYAALFCLEYKYDPIGDDVTFQLRIYQNDHVKVFDIDAIEVVTVMEKIVFFSNYIDRLKEAEL